MAGRSENLNLRPLTLLVRSIIVFPLRDDIPSRRVPFVSYLLIGACAGAFLWQILSPDGGERIVAEFGMIPVRVSQQRTGPLVTTRPEGVRLRNGEVRITQREVILPPPPIPPWGTLVTCMFLHGSLMHIVGNMWFLIVFGDNVEDRFGHLGFLLVYLLSGIVAGLAQLYSDPASMIPTVGASGAIAGVMGAYFLLYPQARVVTLVPLILVWYTTVLPAPIFLGIWFLFQIGSAALAPENMGGVAWWAHVGGFVAGGAAAYGGQLTGWLSAPYVEEYE